MTETTKHRIWFITGTSTGIGRALTELVLERGEVVIATARQPSALSPLTQIYAPDRLLVLPLDITQPQQVAAAFAESKKTFGRIDVVVNNAGISALGEVEALTAEETGRALMETNFWGSLTVTKEAMRFFREENPPAVGGRVLQNSSYLGLVGDPGTGFYAASKHALEAISETLAAEIDPAWNIKITLVEPGYIHSALETKVGGKWPPPHPAYSNPDLPCTRQRQGPWDAAVVWKSTRKSAEVFYKAASLSDPPLHLVMGRDALDGVRRKLKNLAEEIDKYEQWSEGLEE
ncbi:NAD(P)-binding protein [Fomes fomentarius]|nr:NAD(P)-binding protein [Fomes fomentarius]